MQIIDHHACIIDVHKTSLSFSEKRAISSSCFSEGFLVIVIGMGFIGSLLTNVRYSALTARVSIIMK